MGEPESVEGVLGVQPPPMVACGHTISLCVACCTTASLPHGAPHDVARAIRGFWPVRTVLLCESAVVPCDGEDIFVVPSGTKLSKIRRLAHLVETDLFLICDPDITVHEDGCLAVVSRAMEEAVEGNELVAFGVIEGNGNGTFLSQIIAVDKWFSHRILRPLLWVTGVGITLPGQFLVVSSSLLRSLNPAVDSYLDDLYLGWVARRRGVRVRRFGVVVGKEGSRSNWGSLITQRLRWMKGIVSLLGHLAHHPSALALIAVHYMAYHGLPILGLYFVVMLGCANPLAGLCLFLCLATVMSGLSGRSFPACIAFLGVFPLVHVVATLAWWMPITRQALTRR